MADITAIILTKNEEANIRFCIESIRNIVKRVIVVDSYSTDKTVDFALEMGAEIYTNEFINQAEQFDYALNNCGIDTTWVLRIDADERFTEAVCEEVEEICNRNQETDVNGIICRYKVVFMGKYLKHGGIYPFRKLVIFKNGIGHIEKKEMDEHIYIDFGKTVFLKNDCLHEDYKDLSRYIEKHNNYSDREVKDYEKYRFKEENWKKLSYYDRIKSLLKFKVYYKLPTGTRAHIYYMYRYYFRLGFLDGKEGKIFAFLQAYWYRFLVDAKIYEKKKGR